MSGNEFSDFGTGLQALRHEGGLAAEELADALRIRVLDLYRLEAGVLDPSQADSFAEAIGEIVHRRVAEIAAYGAMLGARSHVVHVMLAPGGIADPVECAETLGEAAETIGIDLDVCNAHVAFCQ